MADGKIPLKRAELSIQRFNDVAIPHHLGLLKNHKSNIVKSLALDDWEKVQKEEINAMRVVKEIKNLILEMETLRSKVRDEDIRKFDDLIKGGRDKALEGINDFMELKLKQAPPSKADQIADEMDEEISEHLSQIQSQYQEEQLAIRQACLDQVEILEREVQDLHEIFRGCSAMVSQQGEDVEAIVDCADEALENVQQGEQSLAKALKYRKAVYPVMGAFFGTCVGGPIGLLAGIKAGAIAAIGCGVLGYTGGSVLKGNGIYRAAIKDGLKEE